MLVSVVLPRLPVKKGIIPDQDIVTYYELQRINGIKYLTELDILADCCQKVKGLEQ